MTDEEGKEKRRAIFKKISAGIKLALLLVLIVGIPLYIFFFHHEVIEEFNSIEKIEAFFSSSAFP